MADKKEIYVLMPGAKGTVWAAKPLYPRADGGKFDLEKPESLTQQDLKYLHDNKLTQMVIKQQAPKEPDSKPKKK